MGDCTVSLVKIRGYYDSKGARVVEGIFDVTMSNSYSTGGDTLDLSAYFQSIDVIQIETPVCGSYLLEVDRSSGKVKAYSGVGTEVGSGTDLSSVSFRIRVIGV